MACDNLTPVVQKHLVATTETVTYEWFTGWLPAATLTRIHVLLKSKATSGIFQVQVAMQTAVTRADDPSAPDVVGSTHTNAGEWCGSPVDVTELLEEVALVRFGVAYKVTTSGLAQGDVSLQMAYESCGRVVGTQTLALSTSSSSDSFVPVTGWLTALSAEKVRAVVVSRAEGNFRWKLAYRTAATSVEDSGSWSPLEAEYHTVGEVNTEDLTPTLTDVMWVQYGLLYSSSSGLASATVSVSPTVKKA
ncbi:MAG TPA: hypothetical protein PKW90_22825 [Myxococcota bacterium]|nr:hypothetical protein [Myxococcota bacterium]